MAKENLVFQPWESGWPSPGSNGIDFSFGLQSYSQSKILGGKTPKGSLGSGNPTQVVALIQVKDL